MKNALLEAKDLGDMDLWAIFTILCASIVMLTPMLDWSIVIKEQKSVRNIAVYWGLLIFTALISTFLKARNGIQPFFFYDQLITCDIDIAKNCSREYVVESSTAFKSLDYYDRCPVQEWLLLALY